MKLSLGQKMTINEKTSVFFIFIQIYIYIDGNARCETCTVDDNYG